MKNQYFLLTLLFSFFTSTIYSQNPIQLTHFEDFAYASSKYEVLEVDESVYHVFENEVEEIEAWKFEGNSSSMVYQSAFSLCDLDFYDWKIYVSKVVYLGYKGFRVESILNGESLEEDILAEVDYFNEVEYELDESLLKMEVDNELTHIYDLDENTFVPIFQGDLRYKTSEYYYYIEGENTEKQFCRKRFLEQETEKEVIASGFNSYFAGIFKDRLYFKGRNAPLTYRIDQNDAVESHTLFEGFLADMLVTEEGELFAYEIQEENRYLHLFDEGGLVLVQTFDIGDDPFSRMLKYDDGKLFYLNNQSPSQLAYFDLDENSAVEIATLESFINSYQVIDSLLLFKTQSQGGSKIRVFNIHSLQEKSFHLTPHSLNDYSHSNPWVKFEGDYYLFQYDFETGHSFFAYDFEDNSLSQTGTISNRNYGVGNQLGLIGNLPYIIDLDRFSRSIKIYDSEADDGIYVHEIGTGLAGEIAVIDKKFYYFTTHEFNDTPPSDSNYVDLRVFDPISKESSLALEAISYPSFKIKADYAVAGQYILLPDVYVSSVPKVYDTVNQEVFEVSEDTKSLLSNFRNVVGKTQIYSAMNLSDGLSLYKISKDNIEEYEMITSVSSSSLQYINDDAIAFTSNDSLFYYDGTNLKNYYHTTDSDENINQQVFLSTDRRYLAHRFKRAQTSGYLVYDTKLGEFHKVEINLAEGQTAIVYGSSLWGDDYLFFPAWIENTSYSLQSYHFPSKSSNSKTLNFSPQILSLFNGEVHIEDQKANQIKIFNYALENVETISSESLTDFNSFRTNLINSKENPMLIYSHRFEKPHRMMHVYDAAKRSVTPYFSCDSDLHLKGFVLQDSTVYCTASNGVSGNQIYSFEMENYTTDIGETSNSTAKNVLSLFPNPSADVLYFHDKLTQLRIYDINGRMVMESKAPLKELNIRNLKSGFYFIEAKLKNEFLRAKFVKE